MWGDLKALNSRAEDVMEDVGVHDSPENQFLAYLSVVPSNSIKARIILVLLARFGGWGLTAETQHTYWSRVLDPPIFKLHTWWNSEPPLSSNDTRWTGGAWLPSDSPLEEKGHWLSVPTNTVCVSSTCLLVFPHCLTLCVYL